MHLDGFVIRIYEDARSSEYEIRPGTKHITMICAQIVYFFSVMSEFKQLRWSRGSVLAFGTQVRGFKPGRSRRIFKGK